MTQPQTRAVNDTELYLDYDSMCVCGHPAGVHHISHFVGGALVDECEFYGWDEVGGMMPGEPDGDEEEWVDHCQSFRPVEGIE